MTKNCYHKKLMGIVENNNLKKLGHIILGLQSESNNYLQITANTSEPVNIVMLKGSISSVNGGTLIDSTHATITGTSDYPGIQTAEPNEDVIIDFDNYYNLKVLGNLNSSDNVEYIKNTHIMSLNIVPLQESKFDVSSLKDLKSLKVLNLTFKNTGEYLYGNLEFLSEFTQLERLTLFKVPAGYQDLAFTPETISEITSLRYLAFDDVKIISFATKNIAEFYGKLTNLTTLRLQGTVSKGTVEDFVAAQIANGRATCSGIDIGANMGANVTFQGVAIAGFNGKTLSWTSTNDITIA